MFMCVFVLRTSVRAVFTNHEVVVFQPRIETAPDLGSVAYYTFYFNTLAPLVSTFFLDIFFPLYSNDSPISRVCCSTPSLLHPLPTNSPVTRRSPPGHCPHPPTAIFRRSSLHTATCACVWHCVPWLYAPPFSTLGMLPGPCQPLGGFLVSDTSVSPVPLSRPPWAILCIPESSGVWFLLGGFHTRARGQVTSTPWQLLALVISPLTNWPYRRRSGYSYPPPPSSIYLPPLLSWYHSRW